MRKVLFACLAIMASYQARSQNIYPFTPPDWDGPVVINSVAENYTIDSDLLEGYQLYFSFALQHDFSDDLDGINIEIQVNGNEYRTRVFSPIRPAGSWGWDRDLPIVLPEGTHELRIIIDPDNEFSETVETDNEASITVNVTASPDFELPTVSAVASAEYFIDTDPGFGNGTAISFTEGMDITNSFTADLSNISTGFHQLYFRARNADGLWGPTQVTSFINLVAESDEIQLIEYFIDSDPGFGDATSVSFTPGDEEITFNVDLSTENTGFHQLFVRAKSQNGTWSILQKAGFLVEKGAGRGADIVALEYYYIGPSETSELFEYELMSPGQDIDLVAPLDITFLEDGLDYTLVVRALDASGAKSLLATESFTFNSNFKPEIEDQAFSVNENSALSTEIGQLEANDDDGDQLTFSLDTEGIDEVISLSSDGSLSVLDSVFFNFEDTTSLEFQVMLSDGKELDSAVITIDILDANDIPVIANQNFSIDENSPNDALVGQVEASDEDGDELTFAILSGNENGTFELSATGELTIADSTLLDFEEFPTSFLEVEVSDPEGATAISTIAVELLDLNDKPIMTDQELDLVENSQNGAEVGQLVAVDQDGDDLAYSFNSPGIEEVFTLSVSGNLTVLDEAILNFEDTASFEFEVKVSDGALFDSATVVINILDTNDLPLIEDQFFTIDENPLNGATVGQLMATDEDGDVLTYEFLQVLNGDFDDAFLVASSGLISVSDSSFLNFEDLDVLQFEVRVFDPDGGSAVGVVSVELNDINDIPILETSINDQVFLEGFESAEINLLEPFAIVFTDEDGDDLTYMVSSSNADVVAVTESGGTITLVEVGNGAATITVTADDGNGGTVSDQFEVVINNVNDDPVIVNPISDLSLDEGFGSEVVDLSAVFSDEDGDALTYSTDFSDDNVAVSAVSGNTLTITEMSTPGTSTITVTADDGNGGQVSDVFDVVVNNVNDAPVVDSPIADQQYEEGFGSATIELVGEFVTVFSDADGDELSYSVSSSNPNVVTVDEAAGDLILTEAGVGTSTITVTANDGNGGTVADAFEVIVNSRPLSLSQDSPVKSYPNPTKRYISLKDIKDNTVFRITSLNGALMKQGIYLQSQPIDLHEFKSGVYVLHIDSQVIKITKSD